MRSLPRRLVVGDASSLFRRVKYGEFCATRSMRQLSNVSSLFIPGQDVPPRALATACHADAISVVDCNLRFAGTITRNENLEPLLPISSWSSLKGWDDFISNLRPDAAYELVTERNIQQAQQSSNDCQSEVSKKVDGRSVDFSKCTDRYKLKANHVLGALPSSPHHFGNWSSKACCYGSLTSLTMRGRGVFAMHSSSSNSWFGNNTVRGFSAQSGNSSSPPLYWQCGSTVMRRPSLGWPPSSLAYSLYQERSGGFVQHCPYGLLDEEYNNENSFLPHFDPIEYFEQNPVMEFVYILGDPNFKKYWKLSESAKYSFHALLSTVSAFHDLGVCFSEISEKSLSVDSSGRMSFIRGKFFFVPRSKEGINKDFRNISKLFRRLTAISTGEALASCIPNDFCLLLELMDTLGFDMRYLIITHSSLLPIDSKATVYMKIYQNVKAKLNDDDFEYLFKSVPYGIGWFVSATSNTFLSKSLRRHERMMRHPLFNFSGDKFELFDTGRHLFAHRYEIYRTHGIWAREVDLMWDMLFGDLTAYLQWGLIKEGILHPFTSILRRIRIEDHFLHRKITRPWL